MTDFTNNMPMPVINIGADLFADALDAQGVAVTRVAWRPPVVNRLVLRLVLADPTVDAANKIAVEGMLAAHPVLVDVQPARDVIPALHERRLLHAGPPINWERMCGPMRGAVIGACIYEGWAKDEAEAVAMAQSGALDFEPCHHYNAVGPMAGITSPSMPVFLVEDKTHRNPTLSTLHEGFGKGLRYRAFAPQGLQRLRWLQEGLD